MRSLPDTLLADARKRFFAKIGSAAVGISNCWEWIGGDDGREGYGQIHIGGQSIKAHRVSFMIYKGEIPEGLEIDHVCENRWCVNPEHLEAVTGIDNIRTMPATQKAMKQKRTAAKPKNCSRCTEHATKALEYACKVEKLEHELDTANRFLAYLEETLRQERREWADFMEKLQLVQKAGADTLCGSKWINAQALTEVLAGYTNGRCR
jgi:hypothetical protein